MAEEVGDDFRKLLGSPGHRAECRRAFHLVRRADDARRCRTPQRKHRRTITGAGGDSSATLLLLRAFDDARSRGAA